MATTSTCTSTMEEHTETPVMQHDGLMHDADVIDGVVSADDVVSADVTDGADGTSRPTSQKGISADAVDFSFWNMHVNDFTSMILPYFTWNGTVLGNWALVQSVMDGVFTRLNDGLVRVNESLEKAKNVSPKTINAVRNVLFKNQLFVKFHTKTGNITAKQLCGALKNVLEKHWKTRLGYLLDFQKCYLLSDTSRRPVGLDKQVIWRAIDNCNSVVDDVIKYMYDTLNPQPVRNADGFDEKGYDIDGFDEYGFNKKGKSHMGLYANQYVRGFDENGYDPDGYDENGYYVNGFNDEGYSYTGKRKEDYDQDWFDSDGYDQYGHHRDTY